MASAAGSRARSANQRAGLRVFMVSYLLPPEGRIKKTKSSTGWRAETAQTIQGLTGARMIRPLAIPQDLVGVLERRSGGAPIPQGRVTGAELALGPGRQGILGRQRLPPDAQPVHQVG